MKSQKVQQRERHGRAVASSGSNRPVVASGTGQTGGAGLIEGRWPVVALAGLSWLLSVPLYEPFSWWPLGFVAMVPWVWAVCASRRAGWVYGVSYLFGSAFFLTQLRWLWVTTGAGHVAASLYLALFFLLAAWLTRHLCVGRGLRATWCFPVVWVMSELVRSHGPLTFPWFLLGHSQIHLPSMIQIADVAGVYGISFVLAAVTGWLVDLGLYGWARYRGQRVGFERFPGVYALAVVGLVAGTMLYGRYRLSFDGRTEGPRIAVLQGDFLLDAVRGPQPVSEAEKVETYLKLMNRAGEQKPDMIVLPETPWSMLLNPQMRQVDAASRLYHEEFQRRGKVFGAYVVVGSLSIEPQPAGHYPAEHRANSAWVYPPDGGEPRRYDKIHLVPFGECVPFRHTKGLFWLYRFLNDNPFNPWGRGGIEYSLTAGRQFTTFTMRTRPPEAHEERFGVTICYEDVIPRVFRRFVADRVGRKRVDFMLNISNDGWFGRGAQQPQHLVNCAFRAVENRVPVARAVNTGVSGFIASDGSWYDVVGEPERHPRAGGIGHRVARLQIDPRVTFYSRHGDLFATVCSIVGMVVLIDAITLAWRRRRARRRFIGKAAT